MSSLTRNPIIGLLLTGIALSTILLGTRAMYDIAFQGGISAAVFAPALAVIPVVLLSPSLQGVRNVWLRLGLSGILWSVSRVALESLPIFDGTGSVTAAIMKQFQEPMLLVSSAIVFIIAVFFIDLAKQGTDRVS